MNTAWDGGRPSWIKSISLVGLLVASLGGISVQAGDEWPNLGGSLANTRYVADETRISPENVHRLEVKWIYRTAGSVQTTPTVSGDTVYAADWGPGLGGMLSSPAFPGGKVHAINRWTGVADWSRPIRDYNDNDINNISRSSPAIAGDLIIIGDSVNVVPFMALWQLISPQVRQLLGVDDPSGTHLYGINRYTGELVWKTQISTGTLDQITQSPTVYDGLVLVGTSSHESTLAKNGGFPCCNFRGSLVALDAQTGELQWQHFMTLDNAGELDEFSGAAVWGGAPVVDPETRRVYVPTGNNYNVPQSYRDCIKAAGTDEQAQGECKAGWEDNHFDSIVALDLDTGDVIWSYQPLPYDAYTFACNLEIVLPLLANTVSRQHCPDPAGPDADFAQAPMLYTALVDGEPVKRLAVGQKNGFVHVLDADTGALVWKRQVGPAGVIGGMEFGSATDGQRIYVQNVNSEHKPYALEAGPEAGRIISGGFWAALDAASGDILWQTPVPTNDLPWGNVCHLSGVLKWGLDVCIHTVQGLKKGPANFALPMGPLTVANGVVFAGVADLDGTLVAMSAETGAILWQYHTKVSTVSAPSLVDGRLYWGMGAKYGREGNKLYSFGLPEDER